MKSLSSKYFSGLLEICVFFKIGLKNQDLPESIRLMTIDELYENIIHSNFQTQLIKQILTLLLSKISNLETLVSGSIGLLKGLSCSFRNQLITLYYTQIALQIYASTQKEESNNQIQQWGNQWSFCSLSVETKFKLLQMLVKLAYQSIEKNISKTKKQGEDANNDEKKSKSSQLEEVLILGQDNRLVYFYFPFLPEYVLTLGSGKWQLLNKKRVKERILELLEQQKNTNNLSLCENLSTIYSRYVKDQNNVEINIRLHKNKQDLKKKIDERVDFLKLKLQDINIRYCQYLTNYENQRWGYLKDRDAYSKGLSQGTTLGNLLQAFKDFYLCSCSKIYKLLSEKEQYFPEKDLTQHYSSTIKYFANIHNIKIKLNRDIQLKGEKISNMIIQNNYVDVYPLFEINVFLLQEAIRILEKKQKAYFQKKKKVQAQNERSLQSSESNQEQQVGKGSRRILRYATKSLQSNSITSPKESRGQMELRKRKKSKKRFGVTIIDSDESEQDSERLVKDNSKQFQKYEYRTRSFLNK